MEEQEKPEQPEVNETPEQETPEERPEINYKAELERKNAEIARLREMAAKNEPVKADYDNSSQDISKWDDNSLKLLKNSADPSHARFKDKAQDILDDRRMQKVLARQQEEARKEKAHQELLEKYPEALDPTSEMGRQISKVMQEYDLSKTPAGRLVAAKIVAAEGKKTSTKAEEQEKSRVARVKGNMVDGDRPKPTESKKQSDTDLKSQILKEGSTQHDAIGKWADSKGLREKFGRVWGQ